MMERKTKAREHGIPPATGWWRGYAVAVGGTAVAALVRWALGQVVGGLSLYITFYLVVYAAVVVGGTGPGVLATVLSVLAVDLLFLEPIGKLGPATMSQAVGMGLFTAINLAVSVLGGQLRKKSQALRQSEERLRLFIEHAPAAIAMLDKEMRYLAVSQRWLADFHLSSQSVLGRSHYEIFPEIPERWKQVHRRCLAGAVERADEDLFERSDGTHQWIRWEIRPWHAAPGSVGGIIIFSEEITARKEAELAVRNTKEALAQANQELEEKVQQRTAKLREALAELEHMSYSMVHDMRAPLRAMQSFAGLMLEKCADWRQPQGLDYLHRIRESSNRLDRLITDALNYNKVVRGDLPIIPVEIGRLLRGMIQTYPNLQPPAAEIALEFKEIFVLGNEALLTQCFGNLLDNATKFVAPGVLPRIRVWAEGGGRGGNGESARRRIGETESGPRGRVRIWVEDNGIGVPKEAQEKIFLMFQRMHGESEYPGTGIGLAIVRKAVERMSGRVGLESESGKGSKFWVELPMAAAEARAEEPLRDAA